MTKHTKETLGFDTFSGYYASILQGYGGFQWSDINYMNATFWQNDKTNWCDTGYQNVIHGAGEAFTWNNNGSVSYGLFVSGDLNETFTLNSMVAASAWETKQPFTFSSYTYVSGQGLVPKASVEIHLSQTAKTIDFANIGKPGDFKNISEVLIVSGSGKYGNTCTYGPYGYTLGNEMAFDNLKVTWNGKIPTSKSKAVNVGFAPHAHGHGGHIAGPQLVWGDAHHNTTGPDAHAGAAGLSTGQSGIHGELMSLGESGAGGLTAQFHLPAVEHFGS
jgi:hypothetical protein